MGTIIGGLPRFLNLYKRNFWAGGGVFAPPGVGGGRDSFDTNVRQNGKNVKNRLTNGFSWCKMKKIKEIAGFAGVNIKHRYRQVKGDLRILRYFYVGFR
jgi:hypothetical protein